MNERQKLTHCVQTSSFALVETVLYLDGHPCDKSALEYYGKVKSKYDEAKADYEEHYGPLTVLGVSCENSWSWVETPWPWELEAN